MEKNLAVKYQSQHGTDSKGSNADCGQASLAMCLSFLGKPITTGEISTILGNPTGFTNIQQLAKVAQDLGFNAESKVDATFNELKSYIDKGLPVIVVGGYGYLNSTQDKEFKGSHIMVVVGYREDDSVYVNDPDFWGEFLKDGDHHVYTAAEFFTFWRNEGNKEGNQSNILFVVSPKVLESTEKVKVIADKGLNGRTQTNTQSPIAVVYPKGTVLDVLSVHEGETVSGNNKWLMVKSDIYVWSGGTEEIKVEKPKETPKPNEDKEDKDKIIKQLKKENERLLDAIKKLNELSGAFMAVEAPEEKTIEMAPAVTSTFDNLLKLLRIR